MFGFCHQLCLLFFLLCCVALPVPASLGVTCHVSHYSMSVSSLFASALQVVVSNVILYEGEFPYLPSNVRTKIAKVMSRRGILNSRNMPLVHSITILCHFCFHAHLYDYVYCTQPKSEMLTVCRVCKQIFPSHSSCFWHLHVSTGDESYS